MQSRQNNRDARNQRDILSVQNLRSTLADVCLSPKKYLEDATLATALRSQGRLSKYEQASPPVYAMSLNHQKAISEGAVGGYEVLDKLRRGAIERLECARRDIKRGNKSSKVGLQERNEELELGTRILLEELFLVQQLLDRRCIQARNYANKADKATRALCEKEQREINIALSLRRRPLLINVTPIKTGTNEHARTPTLHVVE